MSKRSNKQKIHYTAYIIQYYCELLAMGRYTNLCSTCTFTFSLASISALPLVNSTLHFPIATQIPSLTALQPLPCGWGLGSA